MDESPTDYVRATDLDTGHKLTIFRSELLNGNYRELKAEAVDINGRVLPPEHNATKPLSSTTTEAKSAIDTKEK